MEDFELSTREKISDHYIVGARLRTKWQGIAIEFPTRIDRNHALEVLAEEDSKAGRRLLRGWPEKPFKDVIQRLVHHKSRNVKIWKRLGNVEEISAEMTKGYKLTKLRKIAEQLSGLIWSNNTKGVAAILASVFKFARKKGRGMSMLGITQDGKIYMGKTANQRVLAFYSKLFNQVEEKPQDRPTNFPGIKFDERIWEWAVQRLSKHKATGWDDMPDEVMEIEYLRERIKDFLKQVLRTGTIPKYWKFGRLCLLSKEKENAFPQVENTRPIIVLSALYKLLELYWAELTEKTIWDHIGLHQIGFRRGTCTQVNIARFKTWLKKVKKGYVIFVDIKKAYDHVIREKLYDLLSMIGVPPELVLMYREMTTDMRIYMDNGNSIPYRNGVPQGSCISPMLFNLYYEQALKQLSPYAHKLFAYADDLAIIEEGKNHLRAVIAVLQGWKQQFNLVVHDKKTEIMAIRGTVPAYVQYPECKSYKYLGVDIASDRRKLSKAEVMRRVRRMVTSLRWLVVKGACHKISKLAIIWWLISRILYQHVASVFLEIISPEELCKITCIAIKKLLRVKKSVSQTFVFCFLGLDLRSTISAMIAKVFATEMSEAQRDRWRPALDPPGEDGELNVWNYVLNSVKLDINEIYNLVGGTWWHRLGYQIRCKQCFQYMSMEHVQKYHGNLFPQYERQLSWLAGIKKTGFDFLQEAERLRLSPQQTATWIGDAFEKGSFMKRTSVELLGVKNVFKITQVRRPATT